MDFRLTKEEALFQKMCREFALNEVEPIAAEIDAEERYPEETVQKLMKYGLMGIQFPKEVGGPASLRFSKPVCRSASNTITATELDKLRLRAPSLIGMRTQRSGCSMSSASGRPRVSLPNIR